MRVLIIGGTGLISTSIAPLLRERDAEVTLLNRGRTASRHAEDCPTIRVDRSDRSTFEDAVRSAGPWDCVIDMVCFTRDDAESLVRACAGMAAQVIFCSTVDVYRRPASRYPITELEPLGGLGAYATGKAECEHILSKAADKGDFELTVIRPAHTYADPGTLVHSLGWSTTYLDRLRRGKPIVVHGDGSSIWCSCHADDVAVAFANAVRNDDALGLSYHVTGEEWLPWDTYHRIVAEAFGAPPPLLVHIPSELLARADPDRAGVCAINFRYNNLFDNAAARADLGFRYTIPLREGAARVCAWLEKHGGIADSDHDDTDDRLIAAWSHAESVFVAER